MNRVVYANRSGAAAWKCLAVSSQIENPAIQTLGEHAGYWSPPASGTIS
jgi:hypothetical protein